MADIDYLATSDGTGDAALMHINGVGRLAGATVIPVDSVIGVPLKFLGTYGTLLPTNFIDPTTKRDFRGHLSGATLVIDSFVPGAGTDLGNTAGQVVVIKPNTLWANTVAQFIKDSTGLGTPENVTFANIAAAIMTVAGVVNSGDNVVSGNLTVSGQSRTVAATIASGAIITPSTQVYDVTALAVTASVAVPSFTAQNGLSVIIRIKDNGAAKAISFAVGYVDVSGIGLPAVTVAGKLLTIGAMYNSTSTKWEVQGINQQA